MLMKLNKNDFQMQLNQHTSYATLTTKLSHFEFLSYVLSYDQQFKERMCEILTVCKILTRF